MHSYLTVVNRKFGERDERCEFGESDRLIGHKNRLRAWCAPGEARLGHRAAS